MLPIHPRIPPAIPAYAGSKPEPGGGPLPYEDKKAAPQRRPHAVTLDERSHLTVTGVDEVVRFDDTEVSMRTSRGMLTVHGEGLRVGRLAIDTGELAIDGAFDALDYTEETASGGGFWSRLFGG